MKERKAGCLLLCGGKSSRMHEDKAKLLYNKESFLERICRKLKSTGLPCYISLANYEEDIPDGFHPLFDEVKDETGDFIGPMGGIYTGLKQSIRDGLDGLYIVPVDSPLFETELFERIDQAMEKEPNHELYLLTSSSGRMIPVFGYYSNTVVPLLEQLITAHRYSLWALIDRVSCLSVTAESTEQDRMLVNINNPKDYALLQGQMMTQRRHTLLQGEKGVGKSTLIRRILEELHPIIGGYATRAVYDPDQGYRKIYIYPASCLCTETDQNAVAVNNGQLCGTAMNRFKEIYPEVFDTYGLELLANKAEQQLIIMDEIGFMEENAKAFPNKVLALFAGSVPILAAGKTKDKTSPFLESIRHDENTEVIEVTEENREEVYSRLREKMKRLLETEEQK